MRLIKNIVCLSLFWIHVDMIGYWKGKSLSHADPCDSQNLKLLSLLNLLCNTTQTTSIQARDACYGCFFRAGALSPGNSQLLQLSQCASVYLANTDFNNCAASLSQLVTGVRPTTPPSPKFCYTGHCEFVRCVRRINTNLLIDDCIVQNLANRDVTVQTDRIAFYTNTTSCILARARCSAYNPITGEYQIPLGTLLNTYTPTPSNSLQISSTGDIRLISFPANVKVADVFCSSRVYLEQPGYGDAIC